MGHMISVEIFLEQPEDDSPEKWAGTITHQERPSTLSTNERVDGELFLRNPGIPEVEIVRLFKEFEFAVPGGVQVIPSNSRLEGVIDFLFANNDEGLRSLRLFPRITLEQ